jgi:tetratricopeptide (TPR) repeat protein
MLKHFNRLRVPVSQLCLALAVLLLAGCSSKEERAQGYYDRAMQLISEHQDVKARLELRNALQLKDDMVEAWRALAELEQRNNNLQSVIASSRKIAELDPKDIEARIRLARFALLGNALDQALKWVNEAAEIDPKYANAFALRAAISLKLNNSKAAIQEAQKALEIEPGNVESIAVLATEKYLRDDLQGALRTLEDAPPAKKDDVGIILLKIKIYEKIGNLQQLESQLRKLVELHPDQIAFKSELVRFYLANRRFDEAEKEMRAIAAANPANTNAAIELVRFLRAVRGSAAARQVLDVHIKAGGNIFPFQIALADLNFLEGDFAASSQLLEKVISAPASPADALAARSRLAELQLSQKNIPAAEVLISDILRTDNHNIDGLRLRASIRMERGQLDDAVADLRQALNDRPQSPELMMLLSQAYERAGSIDLAEQQLVNATKASGYSPNVGLYYVAFLMRRGGAAQAEDVLVDLATRYPTNMQVLSSLAQVKLSRKDWVGANNVAEAIRRLGSQEGTAEAIEAAVLAGEKKYDKSLGVLQDVYSNKKGSVQSMAALVKAYVQSKKIDQAESFLQSVLKTSPVNPEALELLGTIQALKNKPDQAVKSFKAAMEAAPKKASGYLTLASFYAQLKKSDEALKIIQAGLHELPENLSFRLALANMLESRGDIDGAIAEYETLLKDQPGSMVVANNLASLLSEHRKDRASLEKAYAIAAQLTKSPVPQFKDTLGWLNYLRGDYSKAISLLEDAAKGLPNVALVHYHLAMSYVAVGQSEKALEQLRKVSELEPNNSDLNAKVSTALSKKLKEEKSN